MQMKLRWIVFFVFHFFKFIYFKRCKLTFDYDEVHVLRCHWKKLLMNNFAQFENRKSSNRLLKKVWIDFENKDREFKVPFNLQNEKKNACGLILLTLRHTAHPYDQKFILIFFSLCSMAVPFVFKLNDTMFFLKFYSHGSNFENLLWTTYHSVSIST